MSATVRPPLTVETILATDDESFEAKLLVYDLARGQGRGRDVVEAFNDGMTVAEVAREFGIDADVPPPRCRWH